MPWEKNRESEGQLCGLTLLTRVEAGEVPHKTNDVSGLRERNHGARVATALFDLLIGGIVEEGVRALADGAEQAIGVEPAGRDLASVRTSRLNLDLSGPSRRA